MKDNLETILVKFCGEIYEYAQKKKETYGENNEYFVTLEELDRVLTKYLKESN